MSHKDYDTFNNKQNFNISREMIHIHDLMICNRIYSIPILPALDVRNIYIYIYVCKYLFT